jgi:hypothetical protein
VVAPVTEPSNQPSSLLRLGDPNVTPQKQEKKESHSGPSLREARGLRSLSIKIEKKPKMIARGSTLGKDNEEQKEDLHIDAP